MNSKFECFINVKKKSKIAVDKNKIKKLKKIWYNIYFIFRNVLKSYISMNLKKKKIEILCDTKLSVYSKNFETFFDALCVGFSVKDSSVLLLSDRILFIKVSLENLVDKKYRRKFLIMNLIGKNGIIKTIIENSLNIRIKIYCNSIYIISTYKNFNLFRKLMHNSKFKNPVQIQTQIGKLLKDVH